MRVEAGKITARAKAFDTKDTKKRKKRRRRRACLLFFEIPSLGFLRVLRG